MRLERSFPSAARREQIGTETPPIIEERYYQTGEQPPAGRYVCTYCGHASTVANGGSLPLCATCDQVEFMAERSETTVSPAPFLSAVR